MININLINCWTIFHILQEFLTFHQLSALKKLNRLGSYQYFSFCNIRIKPNWFCFFYLIYYFLIWFKCFSFFLGNFYFCNMKWFKNIAFILPAEIPDSSLINNFIWSYIIFFSFVLEFNLLMMNNLFLQYPENWSDNRYPSLSWSILVSYSLLCHLSINFIKV